MRKVDVVIFFEHKDRELQSALLLKKILTEDYKFSVEIYSAVFDLWKVVYKICPKVVIVPYCRWQDTNTVAIYKYLYDNKVIFINLNYEQICNPMLEDDKKPRDEFARKNLIYACWGDASKKFFCKNGVNIENLYVTGKVENTILKQMALIDKKKIKAEIMKKHSSLREDKKWYFVPMDDNWVFLNEVTEKYYKKGTWKIEDVKDYKKYLTDTVYIFLDWLCELAKEHKENLDFQMIIRPHPSVSIDYYIEYFMEKLGYIPEFIVLSREFTAKEWIIVSDKCVSNYSTLLLDSCFLNISTRLIAKDSIPSNVKMEWFDDIQKITNYDEFLNYMLNIEEKEKMENPLDNYIATYKNAATEICEVIKKNMSIKSIQTSKLKLVKSFITNRKYYLPSFVRNICYKLKINKFSTKMLRYDYLTQEDMAKYSEQIEYYFRNN